MRKIIKNKKAWEIPGAFLPDLFSIIAFFIISLFFFILFGIHQCSITEQQDLTINSLEETIDLNPILINILKTPVSFEQSDLTLADIGILTLYSTEYDTLIRKELGKIFYSLPHEYLLVISKNKRSRRFSTQNTAGENILQKRGQAALTIIPAPDYGTARFTLYRLTQSQINQYALSP